jgi:hypothetical protein
MRWSSEILTARWKCLDLSDVMHENGGEQCRSLAQTWTIRVRWPLLGGGRQSQWR